MQRTLFNLGQEPVKEPPVSELKRKLYQEFIIDRFDSPLGYLIFMCIGFALAYFIGKGGVDAAFFLMGLAFGLPALIASVFHLRFGLFMTLIASVFVLGVKRFINDAVPLGVYIDACVLALIFGLLVKQTRERDLFFIKHPLSAFVLCWIGYSLFQGLNPHPSSIIPWVYTVRHIAFLMLIYFVALYVLDRPIYIRNLLRLWIGLASLGALYGLKQEIWGFAEFEYNWVMDDPEIFELFFVADRFRVFSFFSDPTVFGIMMAASALMCIPFIYDKKLDLSKRIILGVLASLMLVAMIFSGSRTAYIVFPAGLFFMTAMNPKREMFISSGVVLLIGIGLLVVPTDNTQILRLRSAFNPETTESFQIREQNQAYIQPIIQDYPIGNGLGTTGIWGQRFAPERLLSQFPPDSGYVRLGVETGWIGLLFFCTFMAAILWTSVRTYFSAKKDSSKRYALAFFGFLFAMILAHYPQQAITQLPNSIMFYISMAVIIRIGNIRWPEDRSAYLIE